MFDLKIKTDRNTGFLVSEDVVATYTLDQSYVGTYDLVGLPSEARKILPAGYILAFNPSTQKVVPNYTTYGFQALGINLYDVDLGESEQDYHDREIDVLWRGIVFETLLWDNGDFNNVLDATRMALADRIQFVKETDQTRW